MQSDGKVAVRVTSPSFDPHAKPGQVGVGCLGIPSLDNLPD